MVHIDTCHFQPHPSLLLRPPLTTEPIQTQLQPSLNQVIHGCIGILVNYIASEVENNNFARVSSAMPHQCQKWNYPYLMLLFQLAITTRARGLKEQCLIVNVNAASEVLVKGGSGFELELVDNN